MIGIGLMALFSVVLSSISETANRQLIGHYPVDYVMVNTVPANYTKEEGPAQLPPGYAAAVRSRPEFSDVVEVRVVDATLGTVAGTVGAVDPHSFGSLIRPELSSGRLDDLGPGTVIVSATSAITKGLHVGDPVTVTVGQQSVRVRVVGVVTGSLPGTRHIDTLVTWDQLTALAGPGDDASVMARMAPGVSPGTARDALDAVGLNYPLVRVSSLAEFGSEVRNAVSGLLAVFGGLIGIAIVIALAGITNTLALSVMERRRESAVIRALGMTRGQLGASLLTEAALMGVVGAVVGVAFGLVYGRLVVVTAFAAIGPTVVLPWAWIVGLVVLAAVAAALAGVLPARRAAQVSLVAEMADT
jgi:putative ABC transport system permease protein